MLARSWTVRVVGLARLPALDRGAADIHESTVARRTGNSNGDNNDYGITFAISEGREQKIQQVAA